MDESTASASGWKRARDAAWDKLPEIAYAALVALAFFGVRSWVSDRDHTHQIAALESAVAEQSIRLGEFADCVRRPECEAVRAIVHAIELRLAALEARAVSHETTARELNNDWRSRLLDLERQIQRLATDSQARPDPFTGRDGRELENRIRQLEKRE